MSTLPSAILFTAFFGWLGFSQTPNLKTHEISQEVLSELLPEIEHERLVSFDEPPHGPNNFRIEPIDLNGDSEAEISIKLIDRYWCGATGNCVIWVYREDGSGFERLLKVDGIQHLEYPGTKSKGYLDIVGAQHSSAFESELYYYKFDGKQYRLVSCSNRLYTAESDAPPIITPKKCGPQR